MAKEDTHTISNDTGRIQSFSDGIFGFAITLLVLELIEMLHSKNGEGVLRLCVEHWESFFAFLIGFVTILICWINHNAAFEYISKVDTKLMWINGLLLFVVTLTPFPTAILAGYLGTEGVTAVAIYGFNYVLISIAADGICTYAYNHHLIAEEHREYYSSYKIIYRYAILYTIIAFLLCFVSIVIPLIMYALLFSFFAAPKTFASMIYKKKMKRKKVE